MLVKKKRDVMLNKTSAKHMMYNTVLYFIIKIYKRAHFKSTVCGVCVCVSVR